nr:hypothetical protein [Tanacetum cinerariifolium]
NLEEKQLEEEQAVKAQSWKFPVCYDDDDDKEGYNSLNDNIISELPPYSAVTPTEPVDSLIMGDEHLNIIPATESNEIDQHSLNAESDLIESLPNHDSSVLISSKIDSLFDEFAGELTLLKSFPLGIDEIDCHPEKEIRFAKRLLYDNSSPRPPEEIVSDISNADIESFSPSPIPNSDSDPLMEEINLFFNPDDPMPPDIEEDDDDSEGDIPILEELLNNYSLSLPNNESYHFDIPSPYPLQNHQMVKLSDLKQALRGRHPMLITHITPVDVVRPNLKADLPKDKPKADLPKDKPKEKPKLKVDLQKDKPKPKYVAQVVTKDPILRSRQKVMPEVQAESKVVMKAYVPVLRSKQKS